MEQTEHTFPFRPLQSLTQDTVTHMQLHCFKSASFLIPKHWNTVRVHSHHHQHYQCLLTAVECKKHCHSHQMNQYNLKNNKRNVFVEKSWSSSSIIRSDAVSWISDWAGHEKASRVICVVQGLYFGCVYVLRAHTLYYSDFISHNSEYIYFYSQNC